MTDFLKYAFIGGQILAYLYFRVSSDRYALAVWRILITRTV